MSEKIQPITLTADNFSQEVLNSAIPVVVDFWAPWCGPCRVMNPMMTELAETFEGVVKVGKINIDEYPHLATQYRIEAIPHLVFFAQGNVSDRAVGVFPKQSLLEKVHTLIDGEKVTSRNN